MKMIQQGLDNLAQATGKALMGIRKSSGLTTDPDLMLYESFKPEDFAEMEKQYGQEDVLDYIRTMELKKSSF